MSPLQSNLQRALDGLQDAFDLLAPDSHSAWTWQEVDDIEQLKIAISRVQYVAMVNKIVLQERDSVNNS